METTSKLIQIGVIPRLSLKNGANMLTALSMFIKMAIKEKNSLVLFSIPHLEDLISILIISLKQVMGRLGFLKQRVVSMHPATHEISIITQETNLIL